MAELTRKQKKEWAETIYLKDNLTQGEIADKVGVSRATINTWIKDGKWEEKKIVITHTREEQIKKFYSQIAEINTNIEKRDEGQRYANKEERLSLNSLSSNIKKLETEAGVAEIISVGTRFIQFIRPLNLDLAKEVTRLYDIFIQQHL